MTGRIVLCPNPHRDADYASTKRAYEMLRAAGEEPIVCPLYAGRGDVAELGFAPHTELKNALDGARLIVTFGGDGTLLCAARAAAGYGIPILGVNLGTKGFIAETERDRTEDILLAAEGRCDVERRMMLDVAILRGKETIFSDTALNDLVVGGMARMIFLSVFADGHRTLRFSGDGVIVSTPTGTTAYSMAAGGPIVEPSVENIIITPICPHALFARAFVLSPERVVTVEVGELESRCAYASVDGTEEVYLQSGDIICVSKSKCVTHLVKLTNDGFYEKVYRKLGETK